MSDSPGTALVTGASMGIGQELARVFAEHGHPLVLVARSEEKLAAVARELESRCGVSVKVFPEDLAAREGPARLCQRLEAEGVVVDWLANNAGFGSTGPFVDADLGRELEMIQVNVTALAELSHRLGRGMKERRRGGILNIASTAGFQPGPNMATYYATKAFVVSFTEAIAHELRQSGVRVTAYCPGPVATEFARTAGNAESILFKIAPPATARAVARGAYSALMSGRTLAIHGFMNWIAVQMLRLSPRALIRALVAWANSTG